VDEYRQRLSSVSWLMRLLKQRVAIRANREDGCTGHFWESRFHSVPLLDWSAVLGCMIYVDLNPIRARIAKKLQSVAYSSLKSHCGMVVNKSDEPLAKHLVPLRKCCPVDSLTGEISPVRLSAAEYHDLVSRACGRNQSAGGTAIDSLGQSLGLDWDCWKARMAEPGLFQSGAVGRPASLRQYAETVGRKWIADKTRIWAKE
jgi:hypothetical protein